jgi:hypothetical protein
VIVQPPIPEQGSGADQGSRCSRRLLTESEVENSEPIEPIRLGYEFLEGLEQGAVILHS